MLQTLGLEYHYQHGKKIVFPEIEIERGQRLLISGFSGCGKTTLQIGRASCRERV